MNTTGDRSSVLNRSARGLIVASCFTVLCVLVTGCPHNEYTVELQPKGPVIERTLTFYRMDGTDSNGVPNYQEFPTNELAAITKMFPSGAVKQDGQRFMAKAEFAGALPNDVGGFGTYTNFSSNLGEAGFYVERFRGNDDLVARTEKRFRAADQIADLAVGWADQEFGRERGFKKLKKFLNEDFRRDLKNAGLYLWLAQVDSMSNTNALDECIVRLGQYLLERGYLKRSDVPEAVFVMGAQEQFDWALLQRFVAAKLEIPASKPFPKSFTVLANAESFEKSWNRYLSHTDVYRAMLKQWSEKRKSDSNLQQPEPQEVMDGLLMDLCEGGFGPGGDADHLTVRLALAEAPVHSNGKWKAGFVTWDSTLAADCPVPAICYATWSHANNAFQTEHFGGVILRGDELITYCAWRNGLDEKAARDWDMFLADLKPEENLKQQIESFAASPTQSITVETNAFTTGRKLLCEALKVTEQSK